MKSTHAISPAAILALATAAFLNENPNYSDADPDVQHPERVIGDALGLNEFMRDVEEGRIKGDDAVRHVFDAILPFGLIVGVEIGVDPLRLPNLKGLIKKYQLPRAGTKKAA
jgi:hypothetical protein